MALAFRLPNVFVPKEESDERVKLTVVPRPEGVYARVFFFVAAVVVVMGLVVALRAHMAREQMRIDSLNYDISRARQHFDMLRAERAALQSPESLIESAREMGMVPSVSTRIIDIPASIAAEVAATVGKVDADVVAAAESPLDEFGRLKPSVVGSP
jgi:cell division protein FtsL